MGTPLPPNEPGNNCSVCFGVGQPLGDVVTPKFITMKLTDITPGPFFDSADEQELLVPTLLTQTVLPCAWFLTGNAFTWQLSWRFGVNDIFIEHIASASAAFIRIAGDPCLLSYQDLNFNPSNRYSLDGLLDISWSTEGL